MSTAFPRRPLSAIDSRPHASEGIAAEEALPDASASRRVHRLPAPSTAEADSPAATRHGTAPALSRDEWLDLHVSRAPKITVEQWERSLTLLSGSRQDTPGRAA